MNEQDIIQALINHDEYVTQQFFFKKCRPLFTSIIRYVFNYEVDYDEFVNEFYIHLMENDGYRLKQFAGRSSIYQWMKVIAIHYFIRKRDRMIDMAPYNSPLDSIVDKKNFQEDNRASAKIDINSLFELMTNKRYVYVIKRLVLEQADPKEVAEELKTNVDNLYNIKKRAITALTKIALNETEKYEKRSKKQ